MVGYHESGLSVLVGTLEGAAFHETIFSPIGGGYFQSHVSGRYFIYHFMTGMYNILEILSCR